MIITNNIQMVGWTVTRMYLVLYWWLMKAIYLSNSLTDLDNYLMIGWRKVSWNPERLYSDFTFMFFCVFVCVAGFSAQCLTEEWLSKMYQQRYDLTTEWWWSMIYRSIIYSRTGHYKTLNSFGIPDLSKEHKQILIRMKLSSGSLEDTLRPPLWFFLPRNLIFLGWRFFGTWERNTFFHQTFLFSMFFPN